MLTRENWSFVMDAQPVEALWGIGTKTARKLHMLGIRLVEQLASADARLLAEAFGPRTGPWLRELATGEGSAEVSDAPHVARGHGRERTFQQDLTDPDQIRAEVSRLTHELMEDVRAEGRPVVRVVVKVRFAPFFTKQHGVKLAEPTDDEGVIETGAQTALAKFEFGRPVRLLSVRGEFAS
jgi:DNA polymerase-4